MVSFARFKEFFNDIGSSINEMTTFSSDGKSTDGQLTREGKRRSSWHDLGSFFRQKEGAPLEGSDLKANNAEGTDGNVQPQGAQGQPTVIQNRNASGRGQNLGNHNPSARTFSSGATAGSTASQLAPGSRHHTGGYRSQDVSRNGMVRFSNSRDSHHRSSGSRSGGYTGGKPVTRSYSAGAADYQKSNLHQYRNDPRGIASPNYNRLPTAAARQQHINSTGNSTPRSSMLSLSNANSASQQSIHSLPNLNSVSTSGNIHGNPAISQSRSAPVSMDLNSNDIRGPSHNKPPSQVWHSGPPFYGPPNSIDPPKISQNNRPGSASRTTGVYHPTSHAQPGYAQSQPGVRQATSRGPLGNSNDIQYNQRVVDRSRSLNQANQPPLSRINSEPQRHPAMGDRVGASNAKLPLEEDEEILDGRQTQQYYDQMIAQINDKIAKAVERGQSPYAVYAANDDEESDWC